MIWGENPPFSENTPFFPGAFFSNCGVPRSLDPVSGHIPSEKPAVAVTSGRPIACQKYARSYLGIPHAMVRSRNRWPNEFPWEFVGTFPTRFVYFWIASPFDLRHNQHEMFGGSKKSWFQRSGKYWIETACIGMYFESIKSLIISACFQHLRCSKTMV